METQKQEFPLSISYHPQDDVPVPTKPATKGRQMTAWHALELQVLREQLTPQGCRLLAPYAIGKQPLEIDAIARIKRLFERRKRTLWLLQHLFQKHTLLEIKSEYYPLLLLASGKQRERFLKTILREGDVYYLGFCYSSGLIRYKRIFLENNCTITKYLIIRLPSCVEVLEGV